MYTLPALPYAYNALEPSIDERTMQIHHDKHHAAYIKNVNDALVGQDALLALPVEELVKNLEKVPESVRTKVRNNAGGHANHTFFWTIMAPAGHGGGGVPQGALATGIDATFGSLTKFQEQFAASAMGRFGSGWVWLVKDTGKLAIVDTPNQDTPLTLGATPIIGLDVWEHAYYLKYQNMRADYVHAWWQVVNWTRAAQLFDQSG